MSAGGGARALVTGISGQDGSYLAELLRADGVEVHGVVRDARPPAHGDNLAAVRDELHLHVADLLEPGALAAIVERTRPEEIYHLAAPTFVPDSWRAYATTMRAIAALSGELLDAVRAHAPQARVVLAGSREIFGSGAPSPQREDTPCAPTTPYGAAKLAAHQLARLARDGDALHVSSAILYNHESPRRPVQFVTRKITRGVAAVSLGLEQTITLGDLDGVRDWSAAIDVVAGMRLMAAAPSPGDYILASGVGRTVRELLAAAFACVGLEPDGHVALDERFVRAHEPSPAIGDPGRARERLGWRATTSFEELVAEMVAADLARLRAGEESR